MDDSWTSRYCIAGGGGAMSYFGAKSCNCGLIGYHQVPGSLPAFESSTGSEPVGISHCTNWGDDGPALWELTVHGGKLAGLWLLESGASALCAKRPGPPGGMTWPFVVSKRGGRGDHSRSQSSPPSLRDTSRHVNAPPCPPTIATAPETPPILSGTSTTTSTRRTRERERR